MHENRPKYKHAIVWMDNQNKPGGRLLTCRPIPIT